MAKKSFLIILFLFFIVNVNAQETSMEQAVENVTQIQEIAENTGSVDPDCPENNSEVSQANDLSFEAFKKNVNDGKFAKHVNPIEKFTYSVCTTELNSIMGFIPTQSSNCNEMFQRTLTDDDFDSEFGENEEEIVKNLSKLVNKATVSQYMAPGVYNVMTESGSIYTINLNYPALANPIAKQTRVNNINAFYQLFNVESYALTAENEANDQ